MSIVEDFQDSPEKIQARRTQKDPWVQYLIVRKSLQMSTGKISAQVGHGVQKIDLAYMKLKEKTSKNTLVNEIMVSEVICIKPSDNLDYCMELMNSKKIRHLPVMENNLDRLRMPAPTLGQHSRAQLIKAGFQDGEIDQLIAGKEQEIMAV